MKGPAFAVVLMLAMLASAIPSGASGPQAEPASAACVAAAARGPPCGYIMPNLELEFPDKPRCPGAPGGIDASKCIALPDDGAAVSFTGSVIWSWKESEDLSYPSDPQQDIKITFGGTAMNPSWMPFRFEPESYTITAADLADPNNRKVDSASGSPIVYFWYERPVKVTFERQGGPNDAEMDRFVSWQGIQSVYTKAKSTGSGAFYKESFGGEEFRFDAKALLPGDGTTSTGDGAKAPAAGPLLGIATLGLAALGRRRQRA